MKNKLLAALTAAALLLSLAACSPAEQNDPSAGQTHSEFPGIGIQIADIITDNGETTLEVLWINDTDYEVLYGASYRVQREENGQWVDCAIADPVFFSIAYGLRADMSQKVSYAVSNYYDVSKPGTYRFMTSCYVETGERRNCSLWAEFSVEDAVIGTSAAALEYGVQYIRTDGYQEGAQYPKVEIIRSREELNSYYSDHKDTFNLERREKVYSDTTIGFLDACDRYDDAFFESKYLVFVLLEEGSGSIRHEVQSVELIEGKQLAVSINTIVPEIGTDDMAQWHIILELDRSAEADTESDVLVYLV